MNTDWKEALMDDFCAMFERATRDGEPIDWAERMEDFIESVLTTQRAEAYEEGQKHAFGVDREHVKQEGRNELRAELAGKVNQKIWDLEGQEIIESQNANQNAEPIIGHKNYMLALRDIRVALNHLLPELSPLQEPTKEV